MYGRSKNYKTCWTDDLQMLTIFLKIFKTDPGNLSSAETAAVAEIYFVLDTREWTVKL